MKDQPAAQTCPPWPPASPRSWWQQQAPARHHPPLAGNSHADVVVIGGGVTGCSAAARLVEHGASTVLLEARDIAGGASGRNGGFLLAGLAHRPVALASIVGDARALELYHLTAQARDRLFDTAAGLGVAHAARRTGSLRLAADDDEADDLIAEHDLLARAGVAVERLAGHELPDGLGAHFVAGLRFVDDGASLPATWVRALAASAAAAGARLHEHSPVVHIDEIGNGDGGGGDGGVRVHTAEGACVTARCAIIATEAYTPALLPQFADRILPYRSQVLAAAAPRDAHRRVRRVLTHPTWSRRGWDYAQQTADGTLVIGGERVEDVALVRHWREQVCDDDQRWLESWLRRVLDVTPDVVARWAGVLSQTADGFAWVGRVRRESPLFVCAGWGGAGNVLGHHCGTQIADLVATGAAATIPHEFAPERATW